MRWLLLDVGGVLEDVDDAVWPAAFAARWARRLGLEPTEFGRRLESARLPDAGLRCGVEKEFWQAYGAAVGVVDADTLAQLRAEFWDAYCGRANQELLDFLTSVRGRVGMAVLSNSADGARREEERRFGFSQLFDPICYSHELGVAKPDHEAFRRTLEAMAADPEDVLFVDDTPAYVAAARQLGIRSVLHATNASTVAELCTWLAGSGPDPVFDHPRLAVLYDVFDSPRDDLGAYVDLARELRADRILDVGCGTGSLAVRLAADGCRVINIDPAAASLRVARTKTGAARVRWLHGDATTLPPLSTDLALMTGNVAQVLLTEESLTAAFVGIGGALRPGGHLVLEARRPERRVWDDWRRDTEPVVRHVPGVGSVSRHRTVTDVTPPLVSLRHAYRFPDGTTVASVSRLRFWTQSELEDALRAAGFDVVDVRQAPDRPGREFVVVAGLRHAAGLD